MRALYLKRPFDIVISSIGIIISLPLWLIFGIIVWLEDRGPIFYKQERVGKNGHIFRALKFRSMIVSAEKDQVPIQAKENDPRVTKVGKFLRNTAMDELPQLVNIYKADMSFVGPRALRPKEIELHGNPGEIELTKLPGFEKRHDVTPGLTGLAQIYLPRDAPNSKKFRYDLLYIKNRSFCWDLKLIFLSFWITFRGKWETRKRKI